MRGPPSFEQRFKRGLEALGLARPGAHVLVAVSGGCDSVCLLHLLRFSFPGLHVTAAHFDHAMRAGSGGDARWVAGLCRAWEVPLAAGRAEDPPRTEAEAREARYAFLRRVKDEVGATHLATAHHADDQAETVLFRLLRGTGPAGLAGIAPADESGLVRPLLPFWRAEIRRYAREKGVRWREDPSNALLDPARNRIRRQLLPLIERTVAPGARRALARLAGVAREDEAAWERALAHDLASVARREGDAVVLVRERLAGYDSAVAARMLRAVLRRFGTILDLRGTRTALQFISTAPSGRTLLLPGGHARIAIAFGEARVEPAAPAPPPDLALEIGGGEGEGTARVGGRGLRVRWRATDGEGEGEAFALDALALPLTVRGRLPGDRVRTRAGRRPLGKVLAEARVPRPERARTPVVADANGAVVWVPGVARGAPPPASGQRGLTLVIADA
jgi:tRNA(Ile)-lysidine synthase